jgi:hypothetical protein
MTKSRRAGDAAGERFADGMRDRQKNVVWPGPQANSRLVGRLLWKGSPDATAVQRIGLIIFGLGYLFAGLVLLTYANRGRSLPVAMFAVPWLLLGARVLHNAFRRRKAGGAPK